MTTEHKNSLELSFESIPLQRAVTRIATLAVQNYEMERSPHGIALIINNKTFQSDEKTRHGTEFDEENLAKVFQYLGYRIHIFNDCVADEIEKIMEEMRERDHSNHDSFVCCILSHGGKTSDGREYVSGSDSQNIFIDDISKKLDATNCRSLAGKPKVFIIQACRGNLEELTLAAEDTTISCERRVSADSINTATETGDFYYAYATPSGYVAWRSEKGSYYITELCRALATHATTQHLADIVVKANSNLSAIQDVTQTIETRSTLTGTIYFL
jgi:hypothetical protein